MLLHREIYGFETRSALFVRDMLEGGSLLIPHLYGRPYTDYPPLFFILQYLFCLPEGQISALAVSVPSMLSAAGLIILSWRFARRHLGAGTGLLSALCLAALPEFWLKAEKASLDMLLALECSTALVCFYQADEAGSRKKSILFALSGCAAALAGLFTKGPVGLMLPLFSWFLYLAAEKRFGDMLKILPGFSAVCILGFALEALLFLHLGGKSLLHAALSNQLISRLEGSANKPFYYYLQYLLIAFLPWLLWMAPQFFADGGPPKEQCGEKSWWKKLLRERIFVFLLSWTAGILIPFSLAASRHGRYLLPAFVPLSIITGMVLNCLSQRMPERSRQTVLKTLGWITALVMMLILFLFFLDPASSGQHPYSLSALSAAALALALWARFLEKGKRPAFLFSVLMIYAVSSFCLLIEPGISRKESARSFTSCTEAVMSLDQRVVLFKMKPDKNGLKYALYSRAYPKRLIFVQDIHKLSGIPRPFILALFEKDARHMESLPGKLSASPLCTGFIHRKEVFSFRIQ